MSVLFVYFDVVELDYVVVFECIDSFVDVFVVFFYVVVEFDYFVVIWVGVDVEFVVLCEFVGGVWEFVNCGVVEIE